MSWFDELDWLYSGLVSEGSREGSVGDDGDGDGGLYCEGAWLGFLEWEWLLDQALTEDRMAVWIRESEVIFE